MPPPRTVAPAGADDRLERLAWRALTAAAAWSRDPSLAAAPALLVPDEQAGLAPAGGSGAHPWLAWDPVSGWALQGAVPPAVRALLELYLPICEVTAARPLAIAHLGQSLDGHIATASGDSYYVTGADNLRHLHRLRALCHAIVVGAGTVDRDDPQLTARLAEGRNPVRVILDPSRRLSPARRVFTDAAAPTLLIAAEGRAARGATCSGAEVLEVPCDELGHLRLDVLLGQLHARGLHAVFVEGGGTTVSRFLEADLLDRLHVAIAPLLIGSGRPGVTLAARDKIGDCLRPQHRVFRMGADMLFDCDLRTPAVGGESGLERVL